MTRQKRIIVSALTVLLAAMAGLAPGATSASASGSLAITGTVTGQNGVGVANVSVTATDPSGTTVDYGPSTTASDGSYELGVNPGTYDIHFVPPGGSGFNPLVESSYSVTTNQVLDVQLNPLTHTFSGALTDQNGTPISGEQINISASDGNYGGAFADANGNFSFAVQPDVYTSVQINPPSGAVQQYYVRSSANFDLSSGDLSQNFQLAMAPLTVTVHDSSGNPVTNATVGYGGGAGTVPPIIVGSSIQASDYNVSQGSNSPVDANGSVTFMVPQGTAFAPQAIHAYVPALGNSITNNATVTVSGATSITLSPPLTHTFSGTLTDQNGTPISGEQINISASDGNYGGDFTDANGNFSFAVQPDVYTSVQINPPSGAAQSYYVRSAANFDLTSGDLSQNFQLAMAPLTVTVHDSSGNPVTNASVGYQGGAGTLPPIIVGSSIQASDDGVFTGSNSSVDANGSVTFMVPQGTAFAPQAIHAYVPALGNSITNNATVTVSGATSITLSPPLTHTFSGTLTDQNGNPISGEQINISASDGNYGGDFTDANGNFSFAVQPDVYTSVQINPPSGAVQQYYVRSSANFDLTSGDLSQNFQLAMAPLTVTVHDSSGNPVTNASVGYQGGAGTLPPIIVGSGIQASDYNVSQGSNSPVDANGSVTFMVPQGTAFAPQAIHAYIPSQGSSIFNNATVTVNGATTLLLQPQPAADAPLTATPVNLSTSRSFVGTVATFTDADPSGVASSYNALINWGDGNSSTGAIVTAHNGFSVSGTHTYAASGAYSVTVTINDAGGASTTATDSFTVSSSTSTSCSGTSSGSNISGSVTVAAGATCTLAATTITSNVTVGSGATLNMTGGSIGSNITSTGGNVVLNGTTVASTITMSGGGYLILNSVHVGSTITAQGLNAVPPDGTPNRICNSTVNSNLTLQSNTVGVVVGDPNGCGANGGNHFGSNVTIKNNSVASGYSALVSNNFVHSNLSCSGNTPPTTGIAGSNTVTGNKQGQCAGL